MTGPDSGRSSDDSVVRVKIRETRHGNIAAFSDVSAESGMRAPNEAERKAKEIHNKIKSRIDESEYEHDDVIADIIVPEDGEPWIDWNEDVVGAAGNEPHVAADGGEVPGSDTESRSHEVPCETGEEVSVTISGKLAMTELYNRFPDGDPAVELAFENGASIDLPLEQLQEELDDD